jgi:hypothetical protein
MKSTSLPEHTREIVHRFSVSYDVRPESMVLHDHTIRQVGYCVDLYGADGDGPPLSPGDERSKEIYRALREIALQTVQEEDHNCRFELDGFYSSLHYDSDPKSPARVQLTIYILHRNGSERPINAGVAQALHKLEDRLKHLGIHHGIGR